jgi:hypothetical protein
VGVLKLFRRTAPPLQRLPSGTFTADREGRIVISTLSSTFPSERLAELARHIVSTFREAQAADLPLSELVIHYSSLKINARELRGGALVFLMPQTPLSTTK